MIGRVSILFNSFPLQLEILSDPFPKNDDCFFITCIQCEEVEWRFAVFAFESQIRGAVQEVVDHFRVLILSRAAVCEVLGK